MTFLVCGFEGTNIGDWSNGMIGVSKTFGGGSIPSSPVGKIANDIGYLFCVHKNFSYFSSITHTIYYGNEGRITYV